MARDHLMGWPGLAALIAEEPDPHRKPPAPKRPPPPPLSISAKTARRIADVDPAKLTPYPVDPYFNIAQEATRVFQPKKFSDGTEWPIYAPNQDVKEHLDAMGVKNVVVQEQLHETKLHNLPKIKASDIYGASPIQDAARAFNEQMGAAMRDHARHMADMYAAPPMVVKTEPRIGLGMGKAPQKVPPAPMNLADLDGLLRDMEPTPPPRAVERSVQRMRAALKHFASRPRGIPQALHNDIAALHAAHNTAETAALVKEAASYHK